MLCRDVLILAKISILAGKVLTPTYFWETVHCIEAILHSLVAVQANIRSE